MANLLPPGDLSVVIDTIAGDASNLNPPAGNVNLVSPSVPEGELWVITNMISYNGTAARAGYHIMGSSLLAAVIKVSPHATGAAALVWTGQMVLREGQFCYTRFSSVTAGDDLLFYYIGYKCPAGVLM